MEIMQGEALPLSFISGLKWTWVADLLYYDGPLCVHYVADDGANWLYWWIDCDDTHNRWLLLCLAATEIEAWLAPGMDNSRDLWSKASRFIVADMDSKGNPGKLTETTFAGLSESWLPTDYVRAA